MGAVGAEVFVSYGIRSLRAAMAVVILALQWPLYAQVLRTKKDAEGIYLKWAMASDPTTVGGSFGQILKSAERSGGIALVSGCDNPVSPLTVPPRWSLAGALDLLTAVYPKNDWTISDGVVNVLPRQGRPAVLEIQMAHFEWNTADLVSLSVDRLFQSNNIRQYLAAHRMESGLGQGTGLFPAPRVVKGKPAPKQDGRGYQMENATVLSTLNAIVGSYGNVVWSYEQRTCDGHGVYYISAR